MSDERTLVDEIAALRARLDTSWASLLAERDGLRAALKEACDIAGRWIGDDDPVASRAAMRDETRVAEIRKLTEGP